MELNFLIDLSDIDVSFIYELNSSSNDDLNTNKLTDEEVHKILEENGFFRNWHSSI